MLNRFHLVLSAAVCLTIASMFSPVRGADTEATPDTSLGQGKVVALDEFFNHQVKNGKPFHYIWEDTEISGYSQFGKLWTDNGATLASVKAAPTPEDLKKYSIYIICDPNLPDKAAGGKPNYIDPASISVIEDWVKAGGTLVMLANDKANCEFEHYNQLAERFGIKFNADLRNTTPGPNLAHATFSAAQFPDHPIFKGVQMVYMKEISTISVTDPATAIFTVDKEKEMGPGKDLCMATAHVGKGFVFTLGDPWIYNEYMVWQVKHPGNPLPVENLKASSNMVQWLLGQSSAPMAK